MAKLVTIILENEDDAMKLLVDLRCIPELSDARISISESFE